MQLEKQYGFRTDFSRNVYEARQVVTIEDGLHHAIIHAEHLLLGARVRYIVDAEAYESGAFVDVETAKAEFEGLQALLARAITTLRAVCKPTEGTGVEPVAYTRFSDFLLEARTIRDYCQMVLGELNALATA